MADHLAWSGADRNRTDDLLLAKQVRLLVVTWTVVQICAVSKHFDSQWLAAFCILQHPLTVPTRDGLGLARKGPDGSKSSVSSLPGRFAITGPGSHRSRMHGMPAGQLTRERRAVRARHGTVGRTGLTNQRTPRSVRSTASSTGSSSSVCAA